MDISRVTYRDLKMDERDQLLPALRTMNWGIPFPDMAAVKVAQDGDEIIGFVVSQFLIHSEPIWVKPEWRGSGVAESLAAHATEALKAKSIPFLCVAPNKIIEELCILQGMKEEPGKLFKYQPKQVV